MDSSLQNLFTRGFLSWVIVLERWQLALYHCVCLWHGPNKYFSGVCFSFLFPGFRGPLWVRSSTKFSTHTVEKPISSAKVRAWVLFTSPMYLMGPIWISFHPEGLIEVWSVWVHGHNVVVAIRLYPLPLVFLVLLVAAGRRGWMVVVVWGWGRSVVRRRMVMGGWPAVMTPTATAPIINTLA